MPENNPAASSKRVVSDARSVSPRLSSAQLYLDQSATLSRCNYLSKVATNYQVEMLGLYTEEREEELHQHLEHATVLTSVAWCLFLPLPPLVLICLVNFIPLQDIEQGPTMSFILTQSIEVFCAVSIVVAQIHWIIPEYEITIVKGAWISLCYTVAHAALYMFLMLYVAQGFPVPFAIQLGACAGFPVILFNLYVFVKDKVDQVENWKLRSWNLLKTVLIQTLIILVYAVFGFFFYSFVEYQTYFTCCLPVFKFVFKYWSTKCTEEFSPDLAPITSVFTAELFNAIYVSICLQQANGLSTILFVVCFDLFQNHYYLKRFAKTTEGKEAFPSLIGEVRLNSVKGGNGQSQVVPHETPVPTPTLAQEDKQRRTSSARISSFLTTEKVPAKDMSPAITTSGRRMTKREVELRNYHTSEHLALTEYVEIITPIIYSTSPLGCILFS